MAELATDFSNPTTSVCDLGENNVDDFKSILTDAEKNSSTTEKIDAIYQQIGLPAISRTLEHKIKFKIYLCCIKNNSDFLGLNFVEFAKKLISYFMSVFGLQCTQACEIMLVYANNTSWLFTFDIKLSDLIVFDWYGFFSDDVRFHLKELEHNTELSLLHHDNPLFEEANKLLSDITHFIKPEYRLVMLCYIYLINNHRDFVIPSSSDIKKVLFTLYSKNVNCIDLHKMLTEMIYTMEFPDYLYE